MLSGPHGPHPHGGLPYPIPGPIQHIEGTPGPGGGAAASRHREAGPRLPEAHASDTASGRRPPDSDAMDQGREDGRGTGGLPDQPPSPPLPSGGWRRGSNWERDEGEQ